MSFFNYHSSHFYFCYCKVVVTAVDVFSSLTDSEASPDRPSTSGAISARQKGHVKSASTSHALPLDLPSSSSATTTIAGNATTAVEDLIR